MLPALLFLLAAEDPRGIVALMAQPVELSEPLARRMAAGGTHALLHVGALPECDPLLRSGTAIEALQLDPQSWDMAAEARALALVERCEAVVLSGGTWIDWWILTREVTHKNRFAQGLLRAQRSGRSVVGIGGAAEHLSGQALLLRSEIRRPRRNPRGDEALLAGGLALVPELALCTQSARVEDFFEAARSAGHSRAVWLEGAIACVVLPGERDFVWEGPGQALRVDFDGSRRAQVLPARALDPRPPPAEASVWSLLLHAPGPDGRPAQAPPREIEARWNARQSLWELQFGPAFAPRGLRPPAESRPGPRSPRDR